jgi:hypothetical protein
MRFQRSSCIQRACFFALSVFALSPLMTIQAQSTSSPDSNQSSAPETDPQASAPAQGTASSPPPGNLLTQLTAAFSGSQVVQSVQLTGTATWYAGSQTDSGAVNLTASSTGSSQMQLDLDTIGQKVESQTGAGLVAECQWSGKDGVAHAVSQENCWKPTLWFLPAFSFQPSLIPGNLGTTDLGLGTVGSSADVYRHLQSQLVFSGPSGAPVTAISQQSTTDLGLDPTSFLPSVLAYSVFPDTGARIPIAIEVHYSNYQAVSGVQIPFHIQRYVNGSLQLDILVSSAQIN